MEGRNDSSFTKGLVGRRLCRNGERGRELSASGEAGFRALFDGNMSEYSTIPYLCQYLTVRYNGPRSCDDPDPGCLSHGFHQFTQSMGEISQIDVSQVFEIGRDLGTLKQNWYYSQSLGSGEPKLDRQIRAWPAREQR
jgi:hypothetical protein